MNNNSTLLEIVPTKAAALKKEASTGFKAVVFESHKTKPPEESKSQPPNRLEEQAEKQDREHRKKGNSNGNKNDGPEFDMKRARHEVMRFGISGFATKNKKKAEVALAVKLGAKPPKKMYKNYKDLLHEKKISKERREEKLKLRQLGKNQAGAAIVRYKKPKLSKKKNMGEISKHYGVVNPKIGKKR